MPTFRPLLIFIVMFVLFAGAGFADPPNSRLPVQYTVKSDAAAGTITLSTPFYTFRHNLKRGGVLDLVRLTYGKVENLVLQPVASGVQVAGEGGGSFSDLNDPSPKISHERNGTVEIVTVECTLRDARGRDLGVILKTRYKYGWGYVKVRREFLFPAKPLKMNRL